MDSVNDWYYHLDALFSFWSLTRALFLCVTHSQGSGRARAQAAAQLRAADHELSEALAAEVRVKMMNLVFKTRNCVFKTRDFVIKMMNFAA